MTTPRGLVSMLLAIAFASPALAAELPTAQEVVQRAQDAAGGQKTFAALGVLKVDIQEQETTTASSTTISKFTGYLDSQRLANLRLEMEPDTILASSPSGGWASQSGKVDDRPQAPRLAAGTARQKLFPLFLPFTLAMDGITFGEVHEGEFEGTPVWWVPLAFDKLFFTSAIMSSTWFLTVRQSDGAIMAVEFLPPTDLQNVQPEGVRYRYTKMQDVGGVKLPRQILLEGINPNYQLTGHYRVSNLTTTVRGPYEPTLFVNPDRLEELEENVPGVDDQE